MMHDKNLLIAMLCEWAFLFVMFAAFALADMTLLHIYALAWQLNILILASGLAFYSLDLVKEKWKL
jgi:hypothetical protein